MNQSTNQSTNQPTDRPIDQPTNQPINQSITTANETHKSKSSNLHCKSDIDLYKLYETEI